LYGGVGLGKTQLLQAIGQHVAANKKGARVSYMSSEKFTNELHRRHSEQPIGPLSPQAPAERSALIDDVQFLAARSGFRRSFSTRLTPCTRPTSK